MAMLNNQRVYINCRKTFRPIQGSKGFSDLLESQVFPHLPGEGC